MLKSLVKKASHILMNLKDYLLLKMKKVNLHLWDVNLPSSCSIDDNLILYVFFLYFLRKSFFLRSRYCICRTRLHNGRSMSNNGKIQHRFSFRSRLVW